MKAQDYILSQLNRLKTPEVPTRVPRDDEEMVSYIYATLMSKKFRKYASSEEQRKNICECIRLAVASQSPIKFVLPFGGYKLWRLGEAPQVDWAELFMLAYHMRWLKPIVEKYTPGIWFDFSSDEIVIERMNNIPRADTDAYTHSFRDVILFLSHYSPGTMRFTVTPVRDRYADAEFEDELQQQMILYTQKHQNTNGYATLSDSQKKMIELNVRLKQGQTDDPLWREKNSLIHDAYCGVSKRRPYMIQPDKIAVFPTLLPYPRAIAVGTTKTSIAKFWVGVGALERRGDGYIETVLSPSQLEKATVMWEPIAIEGLEGKNFEKIRIV